MHIFCLFIFNRLGVCLYEHRFQSDYVSQLSALQASDECKLVFGLLRSIKALTAQIGPQHAHEAATTAAGDENHDALAATATGLGGGGAGGSLATHFPLNSFHSLTTRHYRLHCFETMSQLTFCAVTDIETSYSAPTTQTSASGNRTNRQHQSNNSNSNSNSNSASRTASASVLSKGDSHPGASSTGSAASGPVCISDLLLEMFDLYVEFCVHNPLYRMGEVIHSFDDSLASASRQPLQQKMQAPATASASSDCEFHLQVLSSVQAAEAAISGSGSLTDRSNS